jgi:hypothetical protein
MIENYYKIVEEAILALGIPAELSRGPQIGQWNLKKGKFDILIDVWEQEKNYLFQIVAPICAIPDDNREAFYLHLLNKNYGMSSMAYAIMEDSVFVKYTSEANSLTQEIILNLLTKVAFYAEQSDFVPTEI